MNYIKKLQLEVKELTADKKCADDIVNELFRYLNSEKFTCGSELDNYVNIKDIMVYLTRIRSVL
jgi:hypothetical protein